MENYAGVTLVGGQFDGFGNNATIIGDVNGDGFADIAVQAPRAGDFETYSGSVYVVFGGDNLPPVTDVDTLDGTNGFQIRPDNNLNVFFGNSGYSFGAEITGLGDVNGDGVDDFAISQGASFYGYYGYYETAGVAHVILGGQNWQAQERVEDLAGFRIEVAGDIEDIVALGDINGDGFNEVGVNAGDPRSFGPQQYDDQVYVDYYYLYDADGNGEYNAYLADGTTPSGDFQLTGQLAFGYQRKQSFVVFGTDQERVSDDPLVTTGGGGVITPQNVQTVPDDAPTTSATIVNTQLDLTGDGFAVDVGSRLVQIDQGDFYYGTIPGNYFGPAFYGGGIAGAGDLNGDSYADIFIRETGVSTDVLTNINDAGNPEYRVIRTVTGPGIDGVPSTVTTFGPEDPQFFGFSSEGVLLGEDRAADTYPGDISLFSLEVDFAGSLRLVDPDAPGAAVGDVSGNDGFDDLAFALARPGSIGTPSDAGTPAVAATDTVIGITIIPGNADGNPFAAAPANFITDTSNVIVEPSDIDADGVTPLSPGFVGFNINTGVFSPRPIIDGPGAYGGDGGALGDINGDGIDDLFILSGGTNQFIDIGVNDVANLESVPQGATIGYLIFGQSDPIEGDIDLADSFGDGVAAADRQAFKIVGLDEALGGSVGASGVGDVDGDGNNDIVFHSGGGQGQDNFGPGGARVLFGGLDNLVALDQFDGTEDGYLDIRNLSFGIELAIQGAGFISEFQDEGDAGPTQFEFTVTRTGDLNLPVSFDFVVTPSGFAPADEVDFVGGVAGSGVFPSGQVSFDPGANTATVTVEVNGDLEIESSEDFTVTISNPQTVPGTNIAIVSGQTSGRIFNDDQPVRIFARNVSVEEGNPGDDRVLRLEIDRIGESDVEVTVDFTVTGLSADAADFEAGALAAASGQQVLAAGQNTAVIEIPIAEDVTIESNESVRLDITGAALSGADAGANVPVIISDSVGFGTIVNDDFPPQVLISLDDGFQLEGTGPGNGAVFTFQIERRGVDNDDTTVTFDINGLASPGGLPAFNAADIQSVVVDGTPVTVASLPATGLQVDFTGNESVKEVVVTISPDATIEPRERFEVRLTDVESTSGLDYQIFSTSRTATVTNDDGRPPVIPPGVEADVFGDPHIVTLDGLGYDFQAVGEYILVETLPGATNPFQVQVRFEPVPGSDLVSVTTRMAVEVNGTTIELDALGPDALLLTGSDGVTAPASAAELALGVVDVDGDGSGDIFFDGDLYTIVLNEEGEQLQVKVMDGSLNICVFLADTPDGNQGNVRGLMGDADGTGDVSDDLALRAGTEVPAGSGLVDLTGAAVPEGTPLPADTPLPQPLDFDTLYGIYADSWRLDGTTGKAASFSNSVLFPPNFPAGVLTVADLPQSLRDAAEAAARAAGLDPDDPVDPTPQDVFDAAVLDFALTGNEDFFEGAAGIVAEPTSNVEPDNAPVLDLVVGVTNAAPGVVLTEGDAGTQAATFSFYRIGDTTSDLVITYDIGGDVDDDDLVGSIGPAPSPVTIAAGDSSTDVIIEFTGDLLTEDDEDITLTITSADDPDALIGAAAASVTIVTDDFPPEASDDGFTTDEDTAVSGNLIVDDNGNGVDDDPDGNTLTLVSITDSVGTTTAIDGSTTVVLVSGAELTVDGTGAFTYDPSVAVSEFQGLDIDEVGEETFTYTISDGNEGTGTGSVTVGVTGLNDAPVAVEDLFIGDEDSAISGNLLQGSGLPDFDPEGGDLLVTSLTVEGVTQSVSAVGDTTFMLASGADLTVNAVGDITLDAAGSYDQLGGGTAPGLYDEAVDGDLSDDNLAPTQISLPGSGTFNLLAGQAGNPRDIDYVTITIPVGSQLDSIVLDGYVGNPPTDGGAFLGIASGNTIPGTAGGHGASDLIYGLLIDEREVGEDLLSVPAPRLGTAPAPGPLAAGEYTLWFNQLGNNSNDVDIVLTTSALGGPLTSELVDFTYTIEDPEGLSDSADSAFLVEGVNDAPEATDDDGFEVAFGDSLTITADALLDNDLDAEGDDLAVVLGTATGGSVNVNGDGDIVFQPDAGFSGEASFTYRAEDPAGAQSEDAVVTVNVLGASNSSPVTTDDVFVTDEDTPINGNLLLDDNGNGIDSDPDGDTLSISEAFGPDGEALVLTDGNTITALDGTELGIVAIGSDGAFFFDPNEEYEALGDGDSDTFSLSVNVSDGQTVTAGTVDILIEGVNDLPTANTITAEFTEDEDIVLTATELLAPFSDVDNDLGDLSVVGLTCCPDGAGDEVLDPGQFTFDPAVGLSIPQGAFDFLPDSGVQELVIEYSVTDGSLDDTGAPNEVVNTVTVTITGLNDAPEIISDPDISVVEEQPFSAQLEAEDPDEGDSVAFEITGGADAALFSLTSDGVLTFADGPDAPDVDAAGGTDQEYEIEVTARDSIGAEDVQDFLITVTNDPADDDPVDPTDIVGTDGTDFLSGTNGDDTFRPLAGFVDLVDLRDGGMDTIVFGNETNNGVREFDYLIGFGPDDKLDLGSSAIDSELNFFGRTFLILEGDGDVIVLFGVSDFDENTQLVL